MSRAFHWYQFNQHTTLMCCTGEDIRPRVEIRGFGLTRKWTVYITRTPRDKWGVGLWRVVPALRGIWDGPQTAMALLLCTTGVHVAGRWTACQMNHGHIR